MTLIVAKLKVAELKSELESRNLPRSGLKADLVKRLQEAIDREQQQSIIKPTVTPAASESAETTAKTIDQKSVTPQKNQINQDDDTSNRNLSSTTPSSSKKRSRTQSSHKDQDSHKQPKLNVQQTPISEQARGQDHSQKSSDRSQNSKIKVRRGEEQQNNHPSILIDIKNPSDSELAEPADQKARQSEPQGDNTSGSGFGSSGGSQEIDSLRNGDGNLEVSENQSQGSREQPSVLIGINSQATQNQISITAEVSSAVVLELQVSEEPKNSSEEKIRPSEQSEQIVGSSEEDNHLELTDSEDILKSRKNITSSSHHKQKELSIGLNSPRPEEQVEPPLISPKREKQKTPQPSGIPESVVEPKKLESTIDEPKSDSKPLKDPLTLDSRPYDQQNVSKDDSKPDSDSKHQIPTNGLSQPKFSTDSNLKLSQAKNDLSIKDLNLSKEEEDLDSTEQQQKQKEEEKYDDDDDDDDDDDPNVPPATESIYISNLVRPLTIPQIKKKLNEFGEIKFFWIDPVRSHAYFNKVSEARVAYRSLHQTTPYPAETGRLLSLTYIPTEQVSRFVRDEEENSNGGSLRGRLELRYTRQSSEGGLWTFELRSQLSGTPGGGGRVIRGLASSIPIGGLVRNDDGRDINTPRRPEVVSKVESAEMSSIKIKGSSRVEERRVNDHYDGEGVRRSEKEEEGGEFEVLRMEENPRGGPDRWFKRTKTKPQLYWCQAKS